MGILWEAPLQVINTFIEHYAIYQPQSILVCDIILPTITIVQIGWSIKCPSLPETTHQPFQPYNSVACPTLATTNWSY